MIRCRTSALARTQRGDDAGQAKDNQPTGDEPAAAGRSIVTDFASAHTATRTRKAIPRINETTSCGCRLVATPPLSQRPLWPEW